MDVLNREIEVVGWLVEEIGRRGALVDGGESNDRLQMAGCGVGEAEERRVEGSLVVTLAGEDDGHGEAKN